MQTIGNSSIISLYFHIPFCKRKCDYCHFYVLPESEGAKQQLLEGFKQELILLRPLLEKKRVLTLYFGGGTPSLFGPDRLNALLQWIRSEIPIVPSAEITLEANPENVSLDLMQAYAEAGVNRVSLGIQTLESHLLQLLGRLHHSHTALQAIHTVYQVGIQNISIDLMYDLPNQTIQHWITTLQHLKNLPISHLSLYNLTIEPHTLFFKKQSTLRPLLPDEETSLAMYEKAIEHLEAMGLHQYEISAFAKSGFESQHNIGYWTGRPFLGLGPSAFSYWEGKRFRNIAHLGKYCQSLKQKILPRDFEEQLDLEARRRELFVIQLRLRQGVLLSTFNHLYGSLDTTTQRTIDLLVKQGYLNHLQDHIALTKKGLLFYDTIASELI